VSGGIFIEHGVHFFDLVASWLGTGTVLSAARSMRTTTNGERPRTHGSGHAADPEPVEEQVVCTCRYAANSSGDGPSTASRQGAGRHPQSGVLFHFEHGFHQPSRMDRQELRLVFERGEVRLFDWVPTHGELRGLLDDDAVEVLAGMLPGSAVRPLQRFDGADRRMRGRFQPFEATALVEISFTLGMGKLELYGQVVRDLAADQIARIRDPDHVRRLTEADSVACVAMACQADRLAIDAP
jgi:predicted dehydrogenase